MNLSLDVRWCETWYLNIFGFKFGKMKWPLTRNWDFGLYVYKFEKWEVKRCRSLSLDLYHNTWTYLDLYSVKWKYWNNPCRENEILVYMVANLINGKVELIPWFNIWFVNLFGFVFGKMKVLEWPLSRKWDLCAHMVRSLIGMKDEFVSRCPLTRNMIFVPIWF